MPEGAIVSQVGPYCPVNAGRQLRAEGDEGEQERDGQGAKAIHGGMQCVTDTLSNATKTVFLVNRKVRNS